jgi:hypothetical protein
VDVKLNKTKPCIVCCKLFNYKSKARDKVCSKECCSRLISLKKTKYTQEQIDQIVILKKQLKTNSEIATLTGVGINKVKEVVKANKLFLTEEQAQSNAYAAKLTKNPNAMQEMRARLTPDVRKKAGEAIKKTYNLDQEKYHKIFSEGSKKMWTKLKADPEKLNIALENKRRVIGESKLGMTYDQYEKIILQIKSDVENKFGTVCTLAPKYGISFVTACRWFNKNGWQNLLKQFTSQAQLDIYNYVKIVAPELEVLLNDRKAIYMELDIYVPELKFAIEYNGLYWHSAANDGHKNGEHVRKKKLCDQKDIQLFAIFEDEWKDPQKQELIKAMIRYRLKKFNGQKIRASELKLVKLNKNKQFECFFNRNHLDGHTKASYAFALVDDQGKIYCCASIRTNHRGEKEIARLATDYNYIVYGGIDKLIEAIPRPIISFSNNRLSTGNVYKKIGFTETTKSTQPSYWYTDLQTRIWRFKCRRINDPLILKIYPTEKLQAENGVFSLKIFGDDRPLFRIEDYGHRKWLLT